MPSSYLDEEASQCPNGIDPTTPASEALSLEKYKDPVCTGHSNTKQTSAWTTRPSRYLGGIKNFRKRKVKDVVDKFATNLLMNQKAQDPRRDDPGQVKISEPVELPPLPPYSVVAPQFNDFGHYGHFKREPATGQLTSISLMKPSYEVSLAEDTVEMVMVSMNQGVQIAESYDFMSLIPILMDCDDTKSTYALKETAGEEFQVPPMYTESVASEPLSSKVEICHIRDQHSEEYTADAGEFWLKVASYKAYRLKAQLVRRVIDGYTVSENSSNGALRAQGAGQRKTEHCTTESSGISPSRVALGRFDNQKPGEYSDGDESNGGTRRPLKRRRQRDKAPASEELLLACPYPKQNPERYSERNLVEKQYRGCLLTDIPRLK